MELKPLPRGLCKTIAYTQLCEAIKKDFGIELPLKTGKEIPKVIEDILGTHATDPLLKEMAEALSQIVAEVKKHAYNPSLEHMGPLVLDSESVMQKYHERESTQC